MNRQRTRSDRPVRVPRKRSEHAFQWVRRVREPIRLRRSTALVCAVVVTTLLAGCSGLDPGALPGGNESGEGTPTNPDQGEPTPEPTPEPEPEPTSEPEVTPEPEPEPEPTPDPEPETPAGGDDTGTPGDVDNRSLAVWLVTGLALLGVGFVVASLTQRRSGPDLPAAPPVSAPVPDPKRSDRETVIALLHDHRGRLFEADIAESAEWSPAHTRRVVDGLVATGDVVRRETEGEALVAFASTDDDGDTDHREAVLALLRQHNRRMFETDLADVLDWPVSNVSGVVDELVASDEVVRRDVEGETLVVLADSND